MKHRISIETMPKTGRRKDPPRSRWSCSCGAGDSKLTSPEKAHAAADKHFASAKRVREIAARLAADRVPARGELLVTDSQKARARSMAWCEERARELVQDDLDTEAFLASLTDEQRAEMRAP